MSYLLFFVYLLYWETFKSSFSEAVDAQSQWAYGSLPYQKNPANGFSQFLK